MYNRYTPQADGSYRKKRVQEPIYAPPSPKPVQPTRQEPQECPPQEPPCNPKQKKQEKNSCSKQQSSKQQPNADGFLKQLLPKDFDTGDLLVILLLLLMAGDCQEDRSTALLTLALYFIL